MIPTDEFESRLRDALARDAALVPSEVGERLASCRYRTGQRRPRVAVVVTLAAAVVGIATALIVSAVSAPSTSSGLQWRLVSDVNTPGWRGISSNQDGGSGLTCPTATTCYEEGSVGTKEQTRFDIAVTHNGGRTWTLWTLPARWNGTSTQGPACASANWCMTTLSRQDGAVSSFRFYVTTNGGRMWTARGVASRLPWYFAPVATSCSKMRSCVALMGSGSTTDFGQGDGPRVDPKALVTTNGWKTWRTVALPERFDPTNVQCFSDKRCIAAGVESVPGGVRADNLYSNDGGRVWEQAATPPGMGPSGLAALSASISCTSPTHCIELTPFMQSTAGGHPGVLVTTDGGQHWKEIGRLPAGIAGGGVACSNAACWAGVAVNNPKKQRPYMYLDSFASPGRALYKTTDSGRDWNRSDLPAHVTADHAYGYGLACPTETTCYALGFKGQRLVFLAST